MIRDPTVHALSESHSTGTSLSCHMTHNQHVVMAEYDLVCCGNVKQGKRSDPVNKYFIFGGATLTTVRFNIGCSCTSQSMQSSGEIHGTAHSRWVDSVVQVPAHKVLWLVTLAGVVYGETFLVQ